MGNPQSGASSRDILERMKQTSRKEHQQDTPSTTETSPKTSREDNVRFTLDLSGSQHFFLKRFALEHGVRASEVVRALLRLAEEDSALAEEVSQQLADNKKDK